MSVILTTLVRSCEQDVCNFQARKGNGRQIKINSLQLVFSWVNTINGTNLIPIVRHNLKLTTLISVMPTLP